METKSQWKRWHKIVLVSLSGILVLLIIIISTAPEVAKTYSSDDIKVASWTLGEELIKQKLKAPSSAKFEDYSLQKVAYADADSICSFDGYVDAQNSFGAMLRSNYSCRLKYLGGDPDSVKNWDVLQCEMFE